MAYTKRQHYIPRCVLKHFSIDGRYVYEGQIKSGKFYKTNINNAMCAKNIYEHKLLEPNAVENLFAETVDAELGEFYKEAVALLNDGDVPASKKCFEKYAYSVMRCYYRSGATLEEYDTAFRSQKGQIILHIFANTSHRYLMGLRNTILNEYKFAVLEADEKGFILGDSFITTTALAVKSRFVNSSNRQIGLKETLVLLPVSSKYCMAFYHGHKPDYIKEGAITRLSSSQCEEINLAIYQASYNKVVCGSEYLLPTLHEKVFAYNFGHSPNTVVLGGHGGKTNGYVNKREAFFYRRDYEVMECVETLRYLPNQFNIGRNDLCYCGSGKKHKKCCIEKTEILKAVYRSFGNPDLSNSVVISQSAVVEESIPIPPKEYQDILQKIKEIKKDSR